MITTGIESIKPLLIQMEKLFTSWDIIVKVKMQCGNVFSTLLYKTKSSTFKKRLSQRLVWINWKPSEVCAIVECSRILERLRPRKHEFIKSLTPPTNSLISWYEMTVHKYAFLLIIVQEGVLESAVFLFRPAVNKI